MMTAKIKPFKVGDIVQVADHVKGLRGMIGKIARKCGGSNYDWVVQFGADSVVTCSFKESELRHANK